MARAGDREGFQRRSEKPRVRLRGPQPHPRSRTNFQILRSVGRFRQDCRMPLPSIEKALLKPDEKVFVINPQKNQPEFKNCARALDLADAVVLWATREAHLPKHKTSIEQVLPGTTLWVCYPKPGKL